MGKKSGSRAPVRAARLEAQANREAIGEQRRQFDEIQALLAPFVESGTEFLPMVQQGATTEGLGDRIGAIMRGEGFDELLDERRLAVDNQISQSGLSRSGFALEEAANLPASLAFDIENMLYGRQQNLATAGQNAAVQQGGFGQQTAGNISSLQSQIGQIMGQGRIGEAQANSSGTSQLLNVAMTAAAIYFSDPRLKTNMEPIGKIGPLTLYEWDWIDGVSDLVGKMSTGFDAEEVAEHYPEYVAEIAGYKAVNYPALTDKLREDYASA